MNLLTTTIKPHINDNLQNATIHSMQTPLQGCKEFILLVACSIFGSNQNSNTMKNKNTMNHFFCLFLFLIYSAPGSCSSGTWANGSPLVSEGRAISIDWNWQPVVRLKYKKLNNNGVLKMNDDDKSKSIELLEESLELKPNRDLIRYNLGIAYMNAGDHEMAIETLNAVTKSGLGDVHFAIGTAHLELSEPDAALESFLRSGSAEAFYNVGLHYYELALYAKALSFAQKALQKDQDDRATALLYALHQSVTYRLRHLKLSKKWSQKI